MQVAAALLTALPEQHVSTRSRLQHVGEILATHGRVELPHHVVRSENALAHARREVGLAWRIHGGRNTADVLDFCTRAQARCDTGSDLADPPLRKRLCLRAESAHRADQLDRVRDHVEGPELAGLHGTYAQHDRVERADIAAGDSLKCRDDVGGGDHGIDSQMRHRRVPTHAAYLNTNLIAGRQHRAGAHRDLARRQTRPVVQGVDLVHGEALEQPLLHHHVGAGAMLLRRLEDHVGSAVEFTRFGEIPRGAQQHGRVTVMAAGVHASLVARLMWPRRRFVHGQAVHVRPQADRPAARAPARDDTDHAGFCQSAVDFDAPVNELVGDTL